MCIQSLFSGIHLSEHMPQISDVKNTIAQLYAVLNIEQHQLSQEKGLLAKLESLKMELEPLEDVSSHFIGRTDHWHPCIQVDDIQ